jgi:3-phenylpropionate/trans-cinnamate dioxygenase ferredoxin reductase subunit
MTVVVIGAGHAGVQAAESLRVERYSENIILLDKGTHLPYQRPPLSKDYMKAGAEPEPMPLRGEKFYADHDIDLRTGVHVTGIDARERRVLVAGGESIAYDAAIIAAGADARRATCAGEALAGVNYLRTLEDAEGLRAELDRGHGQVVVVGAGFIGLEFAAAAAQRGLDVTVIDYAQRPMQRVLSPSMSQYFADLHAGLGAKLEFDEGLDRFVEADGRVSGVVGTSGTIYPCDFAVVGLGVTVDCGLAPNPESIGQHGIIVDEYLQTSTDDVYAIGDLAVFPSLIDDGLTRLESVQNATDMAKTVAKTITGHRARYSASPWFWSNQGPAKLQIAGVGDPSDIVVERGSRTTGKFSQFLFRGRHLVAVESVNSPADHVAARKILEHGGELSMEQVRDHAFDVKAYARGLTPK